MRAYRTDKGEILYPVSSTIHSGGIADGWGLGHPESDREAHAWEHDARPLPKPLQPVVEALRKATPSGRD